MRVFTVSWLSVVVAFTITACRSTPWEDDLPWIHSQSDVDILVRRAEAGDAHSALELSWHFALRGRLKTSCYWLDAAARLGDSDALVELAYHIEQGEMRLDFRPWGVSRKDAVMALLRQAVPSNAHACVRLAQHYDDGFLGTVDVTNAVRYYREAAIRGYHPAWNPLARHLATDGALYDTKEAYYWCSMETRYLFPGSWMGKEMWDLRWRLTRKLERDDIVRVLKEVDRDIAAYRSGKKSLDDPPWSGWQNVNESEVVQDLYRESDQAEESYRQSFLLNGVESNGGTNGGGRSEHP